MACTKRGYPGERAAKAAARNASWRIHTYFCEECKTWHVSNGEKEGHRSRHGKRDPYTRKPWKGES